ncbi:hypothetical protein [Faecalibacterium sp.]
MTFEQVVLLLSLLGGAIYITFQISWTIFNGKKEMTAQAPTASGHFF